MKDGKERTRQGILTLLFILLVIKEVVVEFPDTYRQSRNLNLIINQVGILILIYIYIYIYI